MTRRGRSTVTFKKLKIKDLKKIFDNTKGDNPGKVKMISLHKIFNKARAKTNSKAGLRAPKSCYHLFLKEQFDDMTREDEKTIEALYQKGGMRSREILKS